MSEKDGNILITLKTDSGYEATIQCRIDPDQWGDIHRVLNGTLSSPEVEKDPNGG